MYSEEELAICKVGGAVNVDDHTNNGYVTETMGEAVQTGTDVSEGWLDAW